MQEIKFDDGSVEHLWNTFGEEQIDINVKSKVAQEFFKQTLTDMVKHGADLIRLDAFAYAVKKIGTNDFFVEPEIWDLLDKVRDMAAEAGAELLPEIHEHYLWKIVSMCHSKKDLLGLYSSGIANCRWLILPKCFSK